MPPRTDSYYVNPVLTQLSIGYAPQQFIADQIFPRVTGLSKPTGTYWKFGLEKFGPFPETLRLPGTRAREVEWKASQATFATHAYALNGKVTDEDRDAQDDPIQLEQTTVENTTELIALGREQRVVNLVSDTNQYAAGYTSDLTAKWADGATSTPVADVDAAKDALLDHGIIPNLMVIPQDVLTKLKQSQDLIERIKYTGRAIITIQILQELFDIPTILVPHSRYNTANAGQSASLVDLWTDLVWIGYVAPRPSLRSLSFGFTYEYRPRQVRQWREEDKKSTIYEVEEQVGEAVVSGEAAFLYTNAI